MSKKQGQTAQNKKENYILCVVPLDGSVIDAGYVIRAARFVTDIAQLLDARVSKVTELDRMKEMAAAPVGTAQVWTAIEGMEVRYCIGQSVWELSRGGVLRFEEFVSGKTSTN